MLRQRQTSKQGVKHEGAWSHVKQVSSILCAVETGKKEDSNLKIGELRRFASHGCQT